jgi:hypothetical protein
MCEENYVFDENCDCQCGIFEDDCQSYEIFNSSSCSCTQNWGCDYIMECPLGQKWDLGVCACVEIKCPKSELCEENHLFDENCECQCALDQEDCSEPSPFLNRKSCQCEKRICNPVTCEEGEKFDSDDCRCVPDPDYTSDRTTECVRVPCINRYVWVEPWCKCVCPPRYCEPGTIIGGDCDCIPDPDYTTELIDVDSTTECVEVSCKIGFNWSQEDCQCIQATGYTTPTYPTSECERVPCRNRYVWLQQECQCVCPPMYCEPGTIRGNDCNCIPDPDYTTESIDVDYTTE